MLLSYLFVMCSGYRASNIYINRQTRTHNKMIFSLKKTNGPSNHPHIHVFIIGNTNLFKKILIFKKKRTFIDAVMMY